MATLSDNSAVSSQNLRNEEQVAVIQAGTVISLCEKVGANLSDIC